VHRSALVLTLLAVGASVAGAQAQQSKDPDPTRKVAAGKLPAGWAVRLDEKDRRRYTADDTKFEAMGTGWHITSGPAALYYNAAHTAPGDTYTVTATLIQTKAPAHPEAYGIFISARDLADSAKQDYAYFLVRGTGEYMVNHRAGMDVHKIVPWTAHPKVNKSDAAGKATNTLEARVGADSVRFVVNGATVASIPRDHYRNTSGIAGLRVNHNLDVHVSRFEVKK
jgi:hypothetical protein